MKISASFLTVDNIDNINKLVNCDIDYLHLDIMDGIFVDNKNEVLDVPHIKPLDIHLMVSDVYKYIDKYKTFNPLYITFHYEVGKNILSIINSLTATPIPLEWTMFVPNEIKQLEMVKNTYSIKMK